MAQGFTFAEAFQPPTQTDAKGGFSFAEALGRQPEPAAPGTHVSHGGAAFASPKGIARKPQEPELQSEATSKAPASAGMSGGAVIDPDGRLIGITVATSTTATAAVALPRLCGFRSV